MEIGRKKWKLFNYVLFGLLLFSTTLQEVQSEVEGEGPSESECQPYIEKALKKLETSEPTDAINPDDGDTITENDELPAAEVDEPEIDDNKDDVEVDDDGANTAETDSVDGDDDTETAADDNNEAQDETNKLQEEEEEVEEAVETGDVQSLEDTVEVETEEKDGSEEANKSTESAEGDKSDENKSSENADAKSAEKEDDSSEKADNAESVESVDENENKEEDTDNNKSEEVETGESAEAEHQGAEEGEETAEDDVQNDDNNETEGVDEIQADEQTDESGKVDDEQQEEEQNENADDDNQAEVDEAEAEVKNFTETEGENEENAEEQEGEKEDIKEGENEAEETAEVDVISEKENVEEGAEGEEEPAQGEEKEEEIEKEEEEEEGEKEEVPEEDLSVDIEIPENLRPRDHIDQLLKLDESNIESETVINRIADITLKELKRLYESAIKPLEILYKYRDLSNRHFGDSEIFSKPLVLFMGPWSGGKSSIVNYLTDNEYTSTSLRTGAEPSPAYFNILMYGDEPEVLDGTQLAADFTFAGLQKFGEGLEERLKGLKLPNKLLEKVNIVEIPGILEVRKQVSRVFPFNDACQWFIDRADIIFLVYDPSKLDVGPETEAILDQLKGREHQTRIILNKADQVKPEELMRVQGALIWNISPLMSSAQPPVMYTTSLWSRPYESWAPVRLLHAQERAFLRDLRSAIDKRIEHKIASARRFAVRVRNHAKMVDCYLTTYYNHKSVFGNRKQVADKIIEHPQDYHIYEGLSTLTNISRYDLPDPDVYRDFFRLNPLYDFQQLSATCTYFRGCPINRLDVAIAYDLPELVGKHKKMVEAALAEIKTPVS